MDTRSSSLVVGLYLLGAVALTVIVGLAILRGDRLQGRLALETAGPFSPDEGNYLRRNARTREEFLAAQSAAEVERLRRLLDEKTQTLEQRTALLQQRSAEYQKLKSDFDATADLVLQFLDIAKPAGGANTVADADADAPADEDPTPAPAGPVEIADLREDLSRARILENALAAEIEELRVEVLAAEADIARIEQEAREQADLLLTGERELREAAANALVRVGEPAITALTDALRDERPAVRRWAAGVLGEMGPAASPAVGPLMEALSDRDEGVRSAAAGALRAVGTRD